MLQNPDKVTSSSYKLSHKSNPKAPEVAARLRALEEMDNVTIRREWRRLYRVEAPKRVRRDLLILGVSWKIQEQALGGLSPATKRRLVDLAGNLESGGNMPHARVTRLKPGTKLIREWQGQTHIVTVTEDGFHWNGKEWRTLSRIAGEITGGHWSGPRFFGLKSSKQKSASAAAGE
jgi:hypothetical protein